jgi:hypothetical protein
MIMMNILKGEATFADEEENVMYQIMMSTATLQREL